MDALFTQVEGGFRWSRFTEKGEARWRRPAGAALADATDAQTAAADEVKMVATTKVDVPFDLDGIRDNLHDNIADDALARPGACAASAAAPAPTCAPTATASASTTRIVETKGDRYRCWDNCFNPLYTEETSGHNPRAQKSNRFRNRFSHKFWYYPDKYDSLLCSGCGRCIMHCPTRIDIREVLRVMGARPKPASRWRRRRGVRRERRRRAAPRRRRRERRRRASPDRREGGVDG